MINIISDLFAMDEMYSYSFPFGHVIVYGMSLLLIVLAYIAICNLYNERDKRHMERIAKRIHGDKPGPISDWDYLLARRELEKISEESKPSEQK